MGAVCKWCGTCRCGESVRHAFQVCSGTTSFGINCLLHPSPNRPPRQPGHCRTRTPGQMRRDGGGRPLSNLDAGMPPESGVAMEVAQTLVNESLRAALAPRPRLPICGAAIPARGDVGDRE